MGAPVGVEHYRLSNAQGMRVGITNYGGVVTSVEVPDRKGGLADVALGFERPEAYMADGVPYFGALVGRFGNRIAHGRFTLDGHAIQLTVNDLTHHLHGGKVGFDKVIWEAERIEGEGWTGLALRYRSADGEEGYPGNLDVLVRYRLTDGNELEIAYQATADKPTIVNLTNHSYFNLKGEGEPSVADHVVQINADAFLPTDEEQIPTGEVTPVEDTPFDFRTPKPIGRDIDKDDAQLKAGGYDHTYVIDRGEADEHTMVLAAQVYEPDSGRVMEVYTDAPGVQFYTGNHLEGRFTGKSGRPYGYRSGFCLETQHYPDAPNHPQFPSTVLRPGETYQTSTRYRFTTR